MITQDIQEAVAYLRTRGYKADPAGIDQWHVRITFPYFPQMTIDEQVSGTQLLAIADALRPFSQPVTCGNRQRMS